MPAYTPTDVADAHDTFTACVRFLVREAYGNVDPTDEQDRAVANARREAMRGMGRLVALTGFEPDTALADDDAEDAATGPGGVADSVGGAS